MGKNLKNVGKGFVKTLKVAAYVAGSPAIIPYKATKWAFNTTKDATTATAKGTAKAAKVTWDHREDIVHAGEIIVSPVVKHIERRKEYKTQQEHLLEKQYHTQFKKIFCSVETVCSQLNEFVQHFQRNLDPAISLKISSDYNHYRSEIEALKEEYALENQLLETPSLVDCLNNLSSCESELSDILDKLILFEQQMVMFLETQTTQIGAA